MLGAILVLLLTLACFSVQVLGQKQFYTNGTSGEQCGKGRHHCLSTAKCKTGKFLCLCKPPLVGKGKLGCFRRDDAATFLELDPRLTTFDGDHLDMDIPCRYKVVHYTMATQNGTRASVEVYAKNRLTKNGEYYPKDVLVSISVMTETKVGKNSMLLEGSATDGAYTFVTTILEDSMTLSSLKIQLDFNKYTISTNKDEINNFIVARIEGVGLTVRFRPPPSAGEDVQKMAPGVAIAIDKEVVPYVKFVNGTISSSPYGPNITSQANFLGFDVQLYAYLLAILNTPAIIMDDRKCKETTITFKNICKNDEVRVGLLKTCSHFYTDKKFLSCLHNNSLVEKSVTEHKQLFQYCVQSFCMHSEAICRVMMQRIEATKCGLPSALKDFKCSPQL